MNGKKR
jgi:hypothetical protein